MHTGLGSRVVGLTGLALFAIDRRDVDDAAPALFNHVTDHLFGHVEHAVQVGFDHRIPVFTRHLHEHAVTGDTGVVDQHVDGAVFGLGLFEGFHGGLPRADITHRCVEGKTQFFLLAQPFGMVTCRAAARDDFETLLVQTLADGGPDATHATRDIRYFLTHEFSPIFCDCYFFSSVMRMYCSRPSKPEGRRHCQPEINARWLGQPPCRHRYTARQYPSWHRGVASRAAGSPECGSRTPQWDDRWQSHHR